METQTLDELKKLHTAAIDARNGYEEALEDAEGRGLTQLFRQMISLHTTNADELARALTSAGEQADDDGSFMSTVHRAIMGIRGLFGGLDASVLPGLIDGEKRNLKRYDEALASAPTQDPLLRSQRERIAAKVQEMERSIVV